MRKECENRGYFTDYGFKEEELERILSLKDAENITYNAVYCRFLEALVYSKFYLDKKGT